MEKEAKTSEHYFTVLLIEDNPNDAELIQDFLAQSDVGFKVEWMSGLSVGLERLSQRDIDVVLLDLSLPDSVGLETFGQVARKARGVPILVLTGFDDERLAIQALHKGAQDYLVKDKIDQHMLTHALRYAIERKRIEAALRTSEARYRAIIEDQTELICRFLPDGTLTFVNHAYCRFFNETSEELIGQPIFSAALRHGWEPPRVSISSASPVATTELTMINPSEEVRWYRWTSRGIFNEQGYLSEIQSVGQDISDRKQAEKQQLELAIERETVQALRTFVENASHDLNTPLTIMKSGSYLSCKLAEQLLKQTIALGTSMTPAVVANTAIEAISQTAMKLYQQAVAQDKAASRLQKIVTDLLKISELDRNTALDLQLHDLYSIATTLVELVSPLAADKHISLELERDLDLPFVSVDEDKMEQALQNLLENAIFYTSEGGAIRVRVYRQDQTVAVAIIDNGIGIASEDLPHIFEHFYRVDKARTSPGGGSGLGLSMTQKIVAAHEGRIDVQSEMGKGSTFTIFLPAK